MKRLLFALLAVIAFPNSVNAEYQTFESWKENHFENYPFECVENGVTPEFTRCEAERLLKSDWELKKELNNDELWEQWKKARRGICYHYQNKFFGQGTAKPLMLIACQKRLNSEAERYCITGEDKQCG